MRPETTMEVSMGVLDGRPVAKLILWNKTVGIKPKPMVTFTGRIPKPVPMSITGPPPILRIVLPDSMSIL